MSENSGSVSLVVSLLSGDSGEFTVQLTAATFDNTMVDNQALAGLDYEEISTQLTFLPGVVDQNFIVTLINNNTVEIFSGALVRPILQLNGSEVTISGIDESRIRVTVPQADVSIVEDDGEGKGGGWRGREEGGGWRGREEGGEGEGRGEGRGRGKGRGGGGEGGGGRGGEGREEGGEGEEGEGRGREEGGEGEGRVREEGGEGEGRVREEGGEGRGREGEGGGGEGGCSIAVLSYHLMHFLPMRRGQLLYKGHKGAKTMGLT